MRFGVKPERPSFPSRAKLRLNESTYKVPSDTEESSGEEFEEAVVESSDSEDSFFYASESKIPTKGRRIHGPPKSTSEQRELTEAMASIKLHSTHSDPLTEWVKQNQKEAFEIAQARIRRSQTAMTNLYLTAAKITQTSMEVTLKEQELRIASEVQARQRAREEEEKREQSRWEARNKAIWDQVDKVAATVEARLEAERKAVEFEKQKQEAEKRKIEEERRKREDAERERREKAEAEKRRIAEEKEQEKERAKEEERRRQEAEERERKEVEERKRREKEELSKVDTERRQAGITTPSEDWDRALEITTNVKHGHLKRVKEDSIQRRQWSAIRRGVTLRIGQLTDDNAEITRISNQIFDTIRALDPSSDLYPAALSALAKAIILQAETEVTAKLDTAGPLAAVVINLFNLPGFEEVLWAKMVTRGGGWIIGNYVMKRQGQNDKEFRKLAGYREDETQVDRQTRIGGIVSLYFAICTSPRAVSMLPTPFWPTKIWSFLTRILGEPRLSKQSLAPYVSHRLCLASKKHLTLRLRSCIPALKWQRQQG
ncbi:hypothetical protein FRC19_005381 [Serendipita sp. 401]|nr:hypothetical protein FRC19_005381 [Serendipita sp. 401]